MLLQLEISTVRAKRRLWVGPSGSKIGSDWPSGSRIRVRLVMFICSHYFMYCHLNFVLHQYFIIICFSLLVEKLRGTVISHIFFLPLAQVKIPFEIKPIGTLKRQKKNKVFC